MAHPRVRAANVLAGVATALLFGLGLVISGMTTPHKVTAFLDVFGAWDPSLAFVMVGAIGVHALLFRLIVRRRSPLLATGFAIPTRHDIDARLVVGATLFGAGWALSGICPGPGLVAAAGGVASGSWPLLVFVGSMFVGMKIFALWERSRA